MAPLVTQLPYPQSPHVYALSLIPTKNTTDAIPSNNPSKNALELPKRLSSQPEMESVCLRPYKRSQSEGRAKAKRRHTELQRLSFLQPQQFTHTIEYQALLSPSSQSRYSATVLQFKIGASKTPVFLILYKLIYICIVSALG